MWQRLTWNRLTKKLFWHGWRFTHRRQLAEAEKVWERLSHEQRVDIAYRVLTGS